MKCYPSLGKDSYKILINKYFYLVVITLDIILIKLKCRTGANLHDTRTDRRAFTSPAIACLYEYTFYPVPACVAGHHPTAETIHPGALSGPILGPTTTQSVEKRRILNVFARRTGFVNGAAALTGNYVAEPCGGITAWSCISRRLMDEVADRIHGRAY